MSIFDSTPKEKLKQKLFSSFFFVHFRIVVNKYTRKQGHLLERNERKSMWSRVWLVKLGRSVDEWVLGARQGRGRAKKRAPAS
jgi:hypothetical protein